jgi:hypothetical protein
MVIKSTVLAENSRVNNGVEYVSVTALEFGPSPLLQMFDYGLREDEKSHKGKLVGKLVTIQVETIRSIFSGRPQLVGKLLSVDSK